jgi:transposase
MLKAEYYSEPSELDMMIFEKLIPAEHYLRKLKAAIDFEPLRALVAECYAAGMGAPAEDPVRLLKLSLLQFHYDLSDSQVIRHAQVNVAFRFFLDISLESALPVASLLSQFRTRLGSERFTRVFNEIVRQARAHGLVKDRLRLKDATHVIANVAIPSTIRLVAQARERLLTAAEYFAAAEVATKRREMETVRQTTADLGEEQRLLARVAYLREVVLWGEQWQQRLDAAAQAAQPVATEEQVTAFRAALELAHKVLNDREPEAKDKLRSLVEPEVRTGKHGDYYDGYLLDVSMDADSDLLCALDVLPANGDEAANATALITSEESAQGNDIASLSMDRIGYRGDGLAALSEAEEGPQLTVYVPPRTKSVVLEGRGVAGGNARDMGTGGNFAFGRRSVARVPCGRNVWHRKRRVDAQSRRVITRPNIKRHRNVPRRWSIGRYGGSIPVLSASWRNWCGGTPRAGCVTAGACG